MAVPTRPYYIVFKGKEHMVEAVSPARAIAHVVGDDITELRPARGGEITAWHRADKVVEMAEATRRVIATMPGVEQVAAAPADGATLVAEADAPVEFDQTGRYNKSIVFDADGATAYLVGQGATNAALIAFGRVKSERRLTLENFDILRAEMPAFGEALAQAISAQDPADPICIDDVRGYLEDKPIELDVVVGALYDAYMRSTASAAVAEALFDPNVTSEQAVAKALDIAFAPPAVEAETVVIQNDDTAPIEPEPAAEPNYGDPA